VDAGGLANHDMLRVVFHGYLACHNRLAAKAPPVVGPTKQSSGNLGKAR
jgi:hypothetical protein